MDHAQVDTLLETTAKTLRDAFKAEGFKLKKADIKTNLSKMLLTMAKGEEVTASATPNLELKNNIAGDMLIVAHRQYKAGDKKNALKMLAMAMETDDCEGLMEVISECNAEASSDNQDNINLDESDEDEAINEVLSAMDDDDDSDDDENDDDDDDEFNDDEDSEDEDDDEDEDSEDDDDDDDDEDNDEQFEGVATASLIEKLKDRPEIIAAANKLSMSGKRKEADEFLKEAAKNI